MTDLGNNLFVVNVPEKDSEFYIAFSGWLCAKNSENDGIYEYVSDGAQEKFEIIGTITASDISFDVEPYVEAQKNAKRYLDYTQERKYFDYPELSFRSLLSSKGLFFENPYGKEKPEKGLDKFLEWETAEQNLVQKLIILKRL